MSALHKGKLVNDWLEKEVKDGAFVRDDSIFRHWVTSDGSAGPDYSEPDYLAGKSGFKAESGRYHLYVSYACPWAHRTLIFRKLKGLEPHISVSVVHPDMLEGGWHFATPSFQGDSNDYGATEDHLYQSDYLHQLYTRALPDVTSQITVPVLWDKKRQTIVNNESAEIIRMFNSAFDGLTGNTADFYPSALRASIDAVNHEVYNNVNNGVYRCGFATTQDAYEEAFDSLFSTLDKLDKRLGEQRYLAGEYLTEADWRLFTTLLRFDAVYYSHFKCNQRRISDYPNLSHYLRALYQYPGIKETVHLAHIKRHYYASHRTINPTGIVPKGPELLLDAPHDREAVAKSHVWTTSSSQGN